MIIEIDNYSIRITEEMVEDISLEIEGTFSHTYSNVHISMKLIEYGKITKRFQSFFPIHHPISFGNWGLISFIFDRLAHTNLENTDMTVKSLKHFGIPHEEFNELYTKLFGTNRLIMEREQEPYLIWRGEDAS